MITYVIQEEVMKKMREYLNESPTVFFKCLNSNSWPVEFVTTNLKDIFGYEREDFLSKKMTFLDFIYEEDRQNVINELLIISKTDKEKYELQPYRVVSKDNKILWVKDITKIIKNDNGEMTHYYCYITDITMQTEMIEKLNVSERIISTMYDNSFQFIGLLEPDGVLIKANKTSLNFIDKNEEDVIGKKFWDCPWWNHSQDTQKTLKSEIIEASKGKFIHTQKVHIDNQGNKIYVDFSIKPVYNSDNEVIYLIPEGRNITQSVLNQKQISRYLNIINDHVLVSTTDLEGKIIKFSEKFQKLSGFSKSELLGNRHDIMKHKDNDDQIYKELWETITQGKVWKGEHRNVSKNSDVFWVENIITPNFNDQGEIETYTSIYNDITSKKEIAELLIIDVLTNIYNRRHFNNIFKNELKRSRRHGYNFVLMIIDIDYFKQYNDTYGHHGGDLALLGVANSLNNSLHRPEDFVFRLGGEEFGIITSNISHEGIIQLGNLLRVNVENLHVEHAKNDCSEYLTISVGIKNVLIDCYLDYEDIYKLADDALYQAKEQGRNRVVIAR